jgi:zinc transport system ATP-binding protein
MTATPPATAARAPLTPGGDDHARAPLAPAAVEFRAVTFTYPGAPTPALDDISLRVEPGERLGILGPNGGGKSTLLKIALGLLPGYRGTVSVFGALPHRARRDALIGYVPQQQDVERGFPLSVRQAVTLGAAWRTPPWRPVPRAARERVEHVLGLVGAAAFADRPVGKLSGGQLQRAMIARALAPQPRILILDEPTVGIDAAGQRLFAQLLERVHAELRITILIVSHDLRAIVAGCDRVACLARRLHSHTAPAGLTPQILAEVFSHDVAGWGGLVGNLHLHAHREEDCPIPGAPALHVHTPSCAHTHGHPRQEPPRADA